MDDSVVQTLWDKSDRTTLESQLPILGSVCSRNCLNFSELLNFSPIKNGHDSQIAKILPRLLIDIQDS